MGSGVFASPCPLRIEVFPFLSVVVILHLVLQTSILLQLFVFNSVRLPLSCCTPSSLLSHVWCTYNLLKKTHGFLTASLQGDAQDGFVPYNFGLGHHVSWSQISEGHLQVQVNAKAASASGDIMATQICTHFSHGAAIKLVLFDALKSI